MKKVIKKILFIACLMMCMLILAVFVNAEENTDEISCIGVPDDSHYVKGNKFEFDLDPDSVTKIYIDKFGIDATITDRATLKEICSLLNNIGGVEFGMSRPIQTEMDIFIYVGDESTVKYHITTGWDDRYRLGDDYKNYILVDNKESFTEFDELTRGLLNDIALNKFRCGQTREEIRSILSLEQVSEDDENCAIFTLEHPDASKSYYLHVWFAQPVKHSAFENSIRYKLYQGDKLIDEGDPISQGDRPLVKIDLPSDLSKNTTKTGCSSSVGIVSAGLTTAIATGYVICKKRRKE